MALTGLASMMRWRALVSVTDASRVALGGADMAPTWLASMMRWWALISRLLLGLLSFTKMMMTKGVGDRGSPELMGL